MIKAYSFFGLALLVGYTLQSKDPAMFLIALGWIGLVGTALIWVDSICKDVTRCNK